MSKLSLASFAVLALVPVLALAGCAAPDDDVVVAPLEDEVEVQSQSPAGFTVVAPECRAVLVATGPAVRFGPNDFGCPGADPYVGQKRLAGNLESGLTVLLDEARPSSSVVCTRGASGNLICKKAADRLIEKLCTETRTYECPCGVATTTVDGSTVGYCRNVR